MSDTFGANSPVRNQISHELAEIEHSVLEMAAIAEGMIADATESLTKLDSPLALTVLKRDDDIDARDLAIETACLRLLALHTPLATDLRLVGTAIKMITDIERVGDLAVDIAKIGRKIEAEMGDPGLVDVPRMATLATRMLRDAIEAFVKRDVELAQRVGQRDDQVDILYKDFRHQLHEVMRHRPDEVVTASYLLLAIHHFERIADHAVNIAERVAFMVTGHFEQLAESHRSAQTD